MSTVQNKKIALIAGGMGAEREVSLVTGQAFAKALDELGASYTWIDAGADLPAQLQNLKPDVALLALHGKYAEDGTVQGLCEYLKIPYSGSGVMSSALCMNKYFTKQILMFHQIPTARFKMFFVGQDQAEGFNPDLGWPVVVKPSREGSTVGISIVKNPGDLLAAINLAAQYDREILIEEFIEGTEITVPVFDGRALTPIEISPKQGFYDYQNKYTAGSTEYILPPRLDSNLIVKAQKFALQAHEALQCRTYSRVDFRISKKGVPYVLEINTLPGCTSTSLLPKAAAHDGILFTSVIKKLVLSASLDYAGVR